MEGSFGNIELFQHTQLLHDTYPTKYDTSHADSYHTVTHLFLQLSFHPAIPTASPPSDTSPTAPQ
jgi:hypothetical protein